jgi:transposase-like protein
VVEIRSELPALSDEQIDLAVQLYSCGLGLRPIGRRLGVAANTVRRALLARGG